MQTSLCSAASTRTPPAKGSRRTINLRTKPAQSETNNSPLHESFVSLFFAITGFPKQDSSSRTVRNCPHAGRAVPSATPSDWYYLEPKLYRTFYVCQLPPQTNFCSAAGTPKDWQFIERETIPNKRRNTSNNKKGRLFRKEPAPKRDGKCLRMPLQ